MHVEVGAVRELRFDDGTPVRAASALGRLGDGWLVVQDDATHAMWRRGGQVTRLRVFPPVEGCDVFSEGEGTKHLKPDLEAACEVPDGLLLLGSGSTPRRMRAALVRPDGVAAVADLTDVYGEVARVLGLPVDALDLEGACLVDRTLRWFNRGNLSAGVLSASVDVDLAALLARFTGSGPVPVGAPRRYDLGSVEGVGLAVTDAAALGGGRVLVSAAAEDTPNAVDDGPVVGTVLAVLSDGEVLDVAPLPRPVDGPLRKVEGLAVLEARPDGLSVVGVVDADDPGAPSLELDLDVRW